jgi:hypothetical protein
MAKKARQKPEEKTVESTFEFPVFDEAAYIRHELEVTLGMGLAIVWAVIAGVLSTFVSILGGSSLTIAAPLAIGILIILSSFVVFPAVHSSVSTYTKTEWAGLVALQVFGWIGLWFLLSEILR